LKKLSYQLQPYREVARLIEEILDENFKNEELLGRVLEQLVSYAEYQFGNRVPLRVCREREDGETIDNWTVEIEMLIIIYSALANCHLSDESLGMVSRSDLRFPLYEKMLDLLRPWSAGLDSNSSATINSMTKDQVNRISFLSALVENEIAIIYMYRSQFNLVETHCQRSLSYARLYEGTEDKKADLLCKALNTCYGLRRSEKDYADALIYAEEAYDCAAVAYNPVHPKVQNASSLLIECLTIQGDLCKAELYAQMTLDSLKDPQNGLDQLSEAVARGHYDLAKVITDQRGDFLKNGLDQQSEAVANGDYDLANVINQQKGDIVKAEKLARESLRIRVLIDSNSHLVGSTADLLASILRIQAKLGSETKDMLEQSLANSIRDFGPDGTHTAPAHFNFGIYYRELAEGQQTDREKKEILSLSEIKIKEALRIYTKIFGPNNPKTLQFLSELSITRRLLSEV
jgi:hypothetical protein